MLEPTGQRLTDRPCIDCGDDLRADNWRPSRIRRKEYRCTPCHSARERVRLGGLRLQELATLGGQCISDDEARLLFSLGTDYGSAKSAEETVRIGFVYVITNPAWPGACKVGRAFDPFSRLAQYQTGSPFRDYELRFAHRFEDCHTAERQIQARLSDHQLEGEWFAISADEAQECIEYFGRNS